MAIFVLVIGVISLLLTDVFINKVTIRNKRYAQYSMLYWNYIYNFNAKCSEIKSCYKAGIFSKSSYKEKIKTIKFILKQDLKGLKNEFKKIR